MIVRRACGASRPENGRSTAERLAELQDLLNSGLIQPAGYEQKRAAILDAI
jgi:hypothetical protein